LFCLLAHLLGLALVALTLILGAGRFLVSQDHLSPADAIVVLGGDDHGFPRTRHALDLFRAGYAPTVVFSGGTLKDAGLACSSAQLSLEAARQLGLPAGSALIAPEAQSTYDEAFNLRALARELAVGRRSARMKSEATMSSERVRPVPQMRPLHSEA
jgi:uncharacterized SAM-binding protein YcdF (DUF218 family)